MKTRKYTVSALSSASVLLIAAAALASTTNYTETYRSGSNIQFVDNTGGTFTTIPFPTSATCSGTVGTATPFTVTQTSPCSLGSVNTTVLGNSVTATWNSCSGSGTYPSNDLTITQSYSLEIVSGTYDCTSPCQSPTGAFGIKPTVEGVLTSQAGTLTMTAGSSTHGAIFQVSANCTSTQAAALNNALHSVVAVNNLIFF